MKSRSNRTRRWKTKTASTRASRYSKRDDGRRWFTRSARGLFGAMFAIRRAGSLNLLHVALDVMGVIGHDVEQREPPKLGMHSGTSERLFRQVLQQLVVFCAQASKRFQRRRNLA